MAQNSRRLGRWRPGATAALEQRVADLEADLAEMRRHQVRLAELADLVSELLVPLSHRDEAAVTEAIEAYRKSL